jgi:hypothetical protein
MSNKQWLCVEKDESEIAKNRHTEDKDGARNEGCKHTNPTKDQYCSKRMSPSLQGTTELQEPTEQVHQRNIVSDDDTQDDINGVHTGWEHQE